MAQELTFAKKVILEVAARKKRAEEEFQDYTEYYDSGFTFDSAFYGNQYDCACNDDVNIRDNHDKAKRVYVNIGKKFARMLKLRQIRKR